MAVAVHHLHHTVSAAAAGPSLLAVATPSNEVVLYSWSECRQIAQLEGHEATVAGLAFAGGGGKAGPLRLVSASHDRNAFVWTQQPSDCSSGDGNAGGGKQQEQWRPEMVITKLSKAGLCCAWAPGGRKFALGASERAVDVCYHNEAKDVWAPRLIKKKHGSAVMAVAWHPSGLVLATASADGKLRLFNAAVPEVDGQPDAAALAGSRFGDCLLELPLAGGWGLAAAFSPDGSCLAVASQGSQLTLLSGIDLQDLSSLDAAEAEAAGRVQQLALPCLPLKCVAFLSDGMLAGGGFDYRPVLCSRQGDGTWRYACSLQGIKPSSSGSSSSAQAAPPRSASLSARIKMFEQQAAAASAAGAVQTAALLF
ncbi:actin-related 2 3 complex subunit 1A [Chlorella sorokiniana]|uniref:Arp2/3 complex 41 kDa subunit n=1 Tax=Chlorella sorokiniana TaxID=3076 RepID=A0A2P6TSH2_CHLSO|nr:actin-related 2 3 complex subunit 1A [Chlorella sorokiniana]|eukprot:PRW57017.1 actin-related 2 3 complex subunit 1A [Chlorella sorokiniana]